MAEQIINSRPTIVHISTKLELYKCYMPFVKGGAIFLPKDNVEHQIGSKAFVILTLLNDASKKPLSGRVIWVNRTGAVRGFGLTLGEGDMAKSVKDQIETVLADLPNKKDIVTYTI